MSTTADGNTIKDQLCAAIAARKTSIIALRKRIAGLLADVPVGVVLSDTGGEVCRVVRVCTGASQWSNRTWDVTIKGKGYLAPGGRLIADDLEDNLWDGHNMHHRHAGTPTCGYAHGEPYSYTSGADTRATAERLPDAIARYMAQCVAEVSANDATASSESVSVPSTEEAA